MAQYTPLLSSELLLSKHDVLAIKWLYDVVCSLDPGSAKAVDYLSNVRPGMDITVILYRQIQTLVDTIDFTWRDRIFGYVRYLRKWCQTKRALMPHLT